jgi:hypothetical protein
VLTLNLQTGSAGCIWLNWKNSRFLLFYHECRNTHFGWMALLVTFVALKFCFIGSTFGSLMVVFSTSKVQEVYFLFQEVLNLDDVFENVRSNNIAAWMVDYSNEIA